MIPRRVFKHPFHDLLEDRERKSGHSSEHILVMCDAYDSSGKPLPTNTRFSCAEAHNRATAARPTYGFEQVR